MRDIVVSFCTESAKAENLIKSCDLFQKDLLLIVEDKWQGWGYRLKRVLAEAKQLIHRGFDRMIFVDAYDVVALSHRKIPNLFYDLFISAEINCWPDVNLKDNEVYQNHTWSPWKYAHSQYMLNLKSLDILQGELGFGILGDNDDDQLHMHQVYLRYFHKRLYRRLNVELDYLCDVFQSIAFAHPYYSFFQFQFGNFINLTTRSRPFFAHGNGKTDMGWILKEIFPKK